MLDFNNKYVQMTAKVTIAAVGLLAIFLFSKIISEMVSWRNVDEYPSRTITVTSEGEAVAIADIASFSFSVNEEGTTSDEAQQKATEKMNQALEYLKANAIEDRDIKTEQYSIYPKYEVIRCTAFDCPPASQNIIGYTVSQSVRVKVRDSQQAGKILSELTQFGISNVSGLSFTIDDEDALYNKARKDAVEKAQQKARTLARDLGVRLGDVVSFGEDTAIPYYGKEMMVMSEAAGGAARPAVSLPQGENTYTARVYVTYEIK